MFNSAFDHLGARRGDYYPEPLRSKIDDVNELVYDAINNGVYRTGFASTQKAYEQAYNKLFDALEVLEARLQGQDYLVANQLTEADWRLFTTLIRFDIAYHGQFRCNKKRLVDYAGLWRLTRRLYQMPGIAETVDFYASKLHYYASTKVLKPSPIVPLGPDLDMDEPV